MSEHHVNITSEIEDVPDPELQARWRERRPTGKARTTCLCGVDTGLVPRADAVETFRQHAAEIGLSA
jgi:hypothetical protein